MSLELTETHLRALRTVGASGALREALGELVTTTEFIELVNDCLVVNTLVGTQIDKNAPDARSNMWRLTEAGTSALAAEGSS